MAPGAHDGHQYPVTRLPCAVTRHPGGSGSRLPSSTYAPHWQAYRCGGLIESDVCRIVGSPSTSCPPDDLDKRARDERAVIRAHDYLLADEHRARVG